MTRISFVLLLSLSALATAQAQEPASRADALRTLKGCAVRPVAYGCNEDTAEYLIRRYEKGDSALLQPLLNAGRRSDGAMSETLGVFYSEVLKKNPKTFLIALRKRSPKEQRGLCTMAGYEDGAGMPSSTYKKVTHSLQRLAGDEAVRREARRCRVGIVVANSTKSGTHFHV